MGHIRSLCVLRGFTDTWFLTINGRKGLLSTSPVRGFRTSFFKNSRWPNRSADSKPKIDPVITPFEGVRIENGPVNLSNLWKPLCFTVLVSSGSFVCAAIWQYENMRARALSLMRQPSTWIQERFYSKKYGSWRNRVNNWWNSLNEGQKLFFPICFANCLVFLAWRVPSLQGTMVRYFCSNPASRVVCWPMVLSTFSHYSAFHLLANMYVLYSFSSGAVASLGKEQFLGLYISAGVISSMTSYLHKVFSKPGLSLGASGAIMAVLGYVCTQYPDTKLSIIFLPFFTFPAGVAIKVIMGVDLAGVLLGWKFFDHAAHLGGAATGIAWSYWGNAYIWQKREPILHWWHEIRGSPVK
ncbi:Presenilins-associated rhomboid-like protein [Blattella germanica]|nr:Presenilins-associated rhomboid-like protein [Blattella germanica]